MAVLALTLFPNCSRDLLAAIALHDLGESVTGDVPWGVKRNEELKAILDDIEDMTLREMGLHVSLDGLDKRRLKFLDRLDAAMWAAHHAPDMVDDDDDWQDQLDWLDKEAEELGCELNM